MSDFLCVERPKLIPLGLHLCCTLVDEQQCGWTSRSYHTAIQIMEYGHISSGSFRGSRKFELRTLDLRTLDLRILDLFTFDLRLPTD